MAEQKKNILVVIGATGVQGSSVANTFLSLPKWHVRCLTRNPSKDSAKQFAARGAEVVQADLNDRATLSEPFQNANAIFLNTDFWETWRPAKAALDAEGKSFEEASAQAFHAETTQGKNVVDVAATIPSLERLVVSTLASVSKASKGEFNKSMHSQAKAWIADYIVDAKSDLAKKTSFIYLGAYHDNRLLSPQLDPSSGRYVFALPFKGDKRMPVINARESAGRYVRALVEDEEPGVRLLVYDAYPTFDEIVAQWSERNGKEAVFMPITMKYLRKVSGLSEEHLEPLAAYARFEYTERVEGIIEPETLKNGGK